jgi:hypothetical protein
MPETLQQPLQNHEIAQHLDLQGQQMQSYSAELPGYVEPHDLALHQASNAWLHNRTVNSKEPLVNVNNRGEHNFAGEDLRADVNDLSDRLSKDITNLRGMIRTPEAARDAIRKHYEQEDGDAAGATMLKPEGDLSLTEVKTYLAVLKAQAHPDQYENPRQRDLHVASLDVAGALVDNWAKRQAKNQSPDGKPLDDSAIDINLHDRPEEADLSNLHEHMISEQQGFEDRFHELNQAQIEQLGETVLDAAGVRQRLDDYEIGSDGSGSNTSTVPASAGMRLPQPQAAHIRVIDYIPRQRQRPEKPVAPPVEATVPAETIPQRPEAGRPAAAEQASDAELLAEVVKSAKGRTQIETDMFDGQRFMGDQKIDRARTAIPQEVMRAERQKSKDWQTQPNEVIAFTDLTEPDAASGQTMRRFRYQFAFTQETAIQLGNQYRDDYKKMRFKQGQGGRDAQLQIAVDLPKAVADQLEASMYTKSPDGDPAKARLDPRRAREVVKQLLLNNNDHRLTQEDIEAKVKGNPPYDELPPDWQSTFVSGQENSTGLVGYRADSLPPPGA